MVRNMESPDGENLLDMLEHSYLDFAHAMLSILGERLARGEVTTIEKKEIEFGPGSYGERVTTQQDLWRLIAPDTDENSPWNSPLIRTGVQAHWDAILAKMMQSDGLAPTHGALFEHYERSIRQVFAEPLLQALQTIALAENLTESVVASCTDEAIVAQYRRIRALWLSATLEWQVTAPLQYFDATALSLPLQLTPDFSLTHWAPEDKTQIWNNVVYRIGESLHPQGVSVDHFMRADSCLKRTATLRRDRPTDIQAVGAEAVAILTALRLIKPGPVRLAYVFMEATAGATTHKHYVVQNPLDVRWDLPPTTYQLMPSDIPLLHRLIAGVRLARSMPQPAGLGLALNRFDQSYSRESGEDMIVDLTVALESTLLAGVAGEFSYKFALWGAALLASSRHPQETYELLASLYQIRSKIVHEGQTIQQMHKTWSKIPGMSDPPHLVEACRSVARDILRAYSLQLGNGHNPQAVRKQLEKSVLEALERGGQKQ